MEYLLVPEQAESVDKTRQPEIMITMQVRDKNMGDLTAPDLIIDKLNLCAFPAVNKIISAVIGNYLAGRMPVKCRYCRIIAQNGNSKHQPVKVLVW
jgi:hypothetical protein